MEMIGDKNGESSTCIFFTLKCNSSFQQIYIMPYNIQAQASTFYFPRIASPEVLPENIGLLFFRYADT